MFTLDVLAYVTIVWSRREQCYASKSVTAVCHALPAVPICPSSLIGCLESARSETARGQTAAGGRRPWSGWPMGDGEPRGAQKNRPIYTLNIPGSARNARNPPLARFPPSRSLRAPTSIPASSIPDSCNELFPEDGVGNECICGLIGGRAVQSPSQSLKA